MADRAPYEAFFKLDTGTHTGEIQQMAVSPDGQTLVTAGECTIRVWDLHTRRQISMLLGQVADRSQEIYGCGNLLRFALSPNGRWVVALKDWGDQTEVQTFELATGNLQAAFRWPGWLFDLDFSADGRFMAMVGNTCAGGGRQAVLQLYTARDVVNAGFHRPPRPVASQAFAKARRSHDLPVAVRFIPGAAARRAPHRLMVAAQRSGGDKKYTGVLGWYQLSPDGQLQRDRLIGTYPAIVPATLAASHACCVVAAEHDPQFRQGFGQFMAFDHEGQLIRTVITESGPASLAFSRSGAELLVGLAMDTSPPEDAPVLTGGYSTAAPPPAPMAPAPAAPATGPEMGFCRLTGMQTVQVNLYTAARGDFALKSTYFGHDDDVTALALLDDGTALSAGGDNQAIHFWSPRYRVGEFTAAIRGIGRTYHAPGINEAEQVLFGTLPLRLLPPRHAERQQSFDLRSMTLQPTCPSVAEESDFESAKWSIFALDPVQTIPLFGRDASLDLPPDLTLFVGADDEWVVWSRSGYYDTSPGGAKHVGYHINRGADKEALFVPSDRFKAFYRPDIIRAIVQHGGEDAARAAGVDIPAVDVAQILPPIVELVPGGVRSGAGKVSISFTVQAPHAGNPVKRIWMLRDDRFVWVEPRPKAHARAKYTVTLPLAPGRHVFTILAENRDAKSIPLSCEVVGPERAAASGDPSHASGHLYLLSVGVSDFAVAGTDDAAGYQPLKYAHQDAAAIYNAFAKSTRSPKLDGRTALRNPAFDAVEATLLVNAAATKSAILQALNQLCTRINERAAAEGAERDVLFVFLSGHGTRFQGEPDLYFWNYDMRPTADEMADTGLSMLELGEIVTSVPAEVVLVIDTCHAGMAGSNLLDGFDAEELARRIHAVNERGMYVLSASRGEEKARENDSAGLGVFTSAVVGAWASDRFFAPDEPANSQRTLSMLGLMAGVQELVPFFTAHAQAPAQTPVCRMYGDLLPLSIYKA